MSKIEINNVYKIFGPKPSDVLQMVKNGASKEEVLDKTGHTVGLDDVTLKIEEGETFVCMGLSGSGKSTLIRHLNRLIDPTAGQILVEGKDGYDTAKQLTKNIVPTKVTKVKLYKGKDKSLFSEHNIENQINELFSLSVKLQSGGSIVINTTEALVAIDVNSGKNTSERNIESTALKTNLEAAVEVARQLRLRDLGGPVSYTHLTLPTKRIV